MGKKKAPPAEEKEEKEEESKPKPEAKAEGEDEEEEDSEVVKELKALDDKCLAVERRFRAEVEELRKKYMEEEAPILAERSQVLARPGGDDSDTPSGTPGLRGFWFQALSNHPEFEEMIEEWDVPVLDYLSDITRSYLDASEPAKGFKLEFHFAKNPYFDHSVLAKEFHTSEGSSPYMAGTEAIKVVATEIEWNAGKDVTVEIIQKKPKGGGAKKKKAEKATEEPRDSFFRAFFRSMKLGDPIPEDLNLSDARGLVDEDDEEDSQMMKLYLENEYNMAVAIRDQIVPFAVRFYTGEACPEKLDDDDSDEDSDDDDDDDDDEEEEEEPQIKLAKKPIKKKGGGQSAQSGPGGPQPQECKQQ